MHDIGMSVRAVTSSFREVVRSEVQLAKAEFKDAAQRVGGDAAKIGVFGALAALGVLPLMAFFVIGLGKLLGENYWLSSLLISLFFFVVFGGPAYLSFRRARSQDLSLPETRQILSEDAEILRNRLQKIGEHSQRRSA